LWRFARELNCPPSEYHQLAVEDLDQGIAILEMPT
jgi:hypothetical protein